MAKRSILSQARMENERTRKLLQLLVSSLQVALMGLGLKPPFVEQSRTPKYASYHEKLYKIRNFGEPWWPWSLSLAINKV